MNNGGGTHTVMPKKLAQALMEAGMQHFDFGGMVGGILNGAGNIGALGPVAQGLAGIQGNGSEGWIGGLGKNLGISGTPGVSGFTANAPSIQTQNLQPYINQQQTNQGSIEAQQQSLANQLLAQSQGQGPGQQLIAQQAGQNAAQQAALMASQRGANANPALVARQAAMANAGANQNALNAQAALALQSQGAAANQQAQMANQALQGQSIGQGALAAQNTAVTGGSLGAQNINANTQMANAGQRGGILGGVLGGIGGGLASSLFAKGGEVKGYAAGGPVNDVMGIANYATPGMGIPSLNSPPAAQPLGGGLGGLGNGLGSGLGDWLSGLGGAAGAGGYSGTLMAGGAGDAIGGAADVATLAASHGGKIPFGQMLAGGNVPGKAVKNGDSESNDTVPTMLSPGEIVLPRSVTQGGNVEAKAVEFLRHLKSGKKRGYSAVAEARKAK